MFDLLVSWLLYPAIAYYWTAAVCALGVGLALRAALRVRRTNRRLGLALAASVVVGTLSTLATAYQEFPPISPLFLLLALNVCLVLFVLGLEYD